MAGGLVGALRDHGTDGVATKPGPNPIETVSFVARNAPGSRARTPLGLGNPHRIHQRFELGRFVGLAGRRFDGKGQASAVSNQVHFRAEPAS